MARKKTTKKPATKHTSNAAARRAAAASEAAPGQPVQGTPDQRHEAQIRAEQCHREIEAVCARFRCRIVPVLNPQLELVGGGPGEPSSKGMVSCTYGVAPLV